MAIGTVTKLLVLAITATSLARAAPIKAFEEFPEVMTTETGTQTMGNPNAELGNADVTAPGVGDIRVIEPWELMFGLTVIAFFLACFAMILWCLYWLGIQILKEILWTRGKVKPNEKDIERGEDAPKGGDLEKGEEIPDEVIVDEDYHSIVSSDSIESILSFVTAQEDEEADKESDEPGEVKRILVNHRGKGKRNQAIKWKSDAKLVDVKYFEMDEIDLEA